MAQGRCKRHEYFAAAILIGVVIFARTGAAQEAAPGDEPAIEANAARVFDYWNSERRAAAVPRDLVIDPRGLGYLRGADGSLRPYGHQISAESAAASPAAGGPNNGSGDSSPPLISQMDPAQGAVIGESHTFSAVVTDDGSGVRSVAFVIRYPDGVTTQSFSASAGANDRWTVTLQGFSAGTWAWWVEAQDNAKRGGNRATSATISFGVETAGSGTGGSTSTDTVTNAAWNDAGAVQTAAGRIYFELPSNARRRGPWVGYVCSGTVVVDDTSGRSLVLTAAHCVYDDANKAYARNVLFIPDQDATSGSGTDLNCGNDPMGCWVPSFGVVDVNWTERTFPDNIAWDYAYYVVADNGAHVGASASSDSLEAAAGALPIDFSPPYTDDGAPGATSIDFTHALGYSYSEDPNLMYCAEDMTTEGSANWWLPHCGLSGGASGGPWIQRMESPGTGPVISVNSWGYTTAPGMAGPKLAYSSAACVLSTATSLDWSAVASSDGDAGYAQTCP